MDKGKGCIRQEWIKAGVSFDKEKSAGYRFTNLPGGRGRIGFSPWSRRLPLRSRWSWILTISFVAAQSHPHTGGIQWRTCRYSLFIPYSMRSFPQYLSRSVGGGGRFVVERYIRMQGKPAFHTGISTHWKFRTLKRAGRSCVINFNIRLHQDTDIGNQRVGGLPLLSQVWPQWSSLLILPSVKYPVIQGLL